MGLRNSVGYQQMVDTLKLEWKSPQNKNKILILVEGYADERFYYRFLRDDTTVIRSCGGSQCIIKLRSEIETHTDILAIVIKDSDFARVNGTLVHNENVFYADAHDYEMMCLRSEGLRRNMLYEFCIPYEEDIYDKVFNELELLSFIKWYNYTNHTGYLLKKLPINEIPHEEMLKFEFMMNLIVTKTLQAKRKTALRKDMDPEIIDVQPIAEEEFIEFKHKHHGTDFYEITCGHDFIARFILALRAKKVSINKDEEDLKSVMHPYFTQDDFYNTDLYKSLETWQRNKKVNILR